MSPSQNISRIERILALPSSPIPPDLREAFNDHLRIHHLWLLRVVAVVSTLAFFSYGFADLVVVPDVGGLSMAARSAYLAVTLPLVLLLYARVRNMAVLDLLIPLFVVVANLLWTMLLTLSGSPQTAAYHYAGIIFTFVASISSQVGFFTVLPILLANAGVTLAGAYLLSREDLSALAVFSLAYLPMLLFSLGATWILTRERRRSFLRSHVDGLRNAALSALLESEQATRQQYVRFGSLISHEFRNALGIIDGQVSTLRKEAERGVAQVDRRAGAIADAARRLGGMFDTWLAGDRFQNSLHEARRQRLALRPWLQQWVDNHGHITGTHRVELAGEGLDLEADAHLLEMAVANLVGNACKYSMPGSLVRIEIRQQPGWAGIGVVDQGVGIAPQYLDKVRQPYFRVAPEGAVRGIGLGLSLVDRVARLHGGRLDLASTPGVGSDFCLWLPRQAQAEAAA